MYIMNWHKKCMDGILKCIRVVLVEEHTKCSQTMNYGQTFFFSSAHQKSLANMTWNSILLVSPTPWTSCTLLASSSHPPTTVLIFLYVAHLLGTGLPGSGTQCERNTQGFCHQMAHRTAQGSFDVESNFIWMTGGKWIGRTFIAANFLHLAVSNLLILLQTDKQVNGKRLQVLIFQINSKIPSTS